MGEHDETMTIPEFAELCRERCNHPAQREGQHCGEVSTVDGEPSYTFCGRHFAHVLGGCTDG